MAAAVFFAAPPLDSAVRGRVRSVLDSALSTAERVTGLSISFESVSPSIFEMVSLRRLRASTPRGSTLLSAGRVFLYYDLKAVTRGDFAEALTAIRIEDADLDLDIEADREIIERLSRLVSGGPGDSSFRLAVSGRDVSLKVAVPGIGKADLLARDFDLAPRGEETALSLSADFRVDQELVELGTVSGPVSVVGSLARDLSRGRLELGISARGRDFELRTQRFEVLYGGGRLDLRKVRDEAPLDAELGLDLEEGTLSARLSLAGFAPERAVRVGGRFSPLEPWLSTPYSGTLALEVPKGDMARLSYEARLEASLPRGAAAGAQVAATIRARGDLESVEVELARLSESANSVEYSGSFRFADLAPDGTLGLDLSLRGGKLPLRSSLRFFGHEGEYTLLADEVEAGGALFRDVAVLAARRGEQLDFRASLLLPETAESAPELPSLRFSGEAVSTAGVAPLVRCEGSASWGVSPALDASISLDSVDLGPLEGFFEALIGSAEAASAISGFRLGGELFLSSDFERLSWTAPDLTVVSRSIPGAYALLSLSGNLESVSVRKATLSVMGMDIAASGRVDFEQEGGIGFEAGFSLLDVPYSLRGAYVGGALSLSGDYGISVSARREGEAMLASFSAKSLPLPLAGMRLLLSVQAEGRYDSPEKWNLDVASLSAVPTGEGLERLPRLALAGSFEPTRAQLWELSVEDKYSSVAGAGRLEYRLGGNPSGRILSSIGSKLGQERYEIDLAYADGAVAGEVVFRDSPLARLGALPISGSADGKVAVAGPIADPRLSFDIGLRGAKYRDQTLSARAIGTYGGGIVSIGTAQASYLANRLSLGATSFSLRDGASSTRLSYTGLRGGERLSFSLEAEGRSRGTGPATLASRLADYALEGSFTDLKFARIDEKLLPFRASLSASGLRLEAGLHTELEAYYEYDGDFAVSSRSPLPIRLSASGRIAEGSIDATFEDIELEIPIFSFLFRPADLQLLAGTAVGSLRARGLLADPEIVGSLTVEGCQLRVPGWVADRIGPFDLPVAATGRSLEAYVPSAPVGRGAVSLRAEAALDHWTLSGLTALLRNVEGTQVALATSLLGITVAGDADFSLNAEFRGDTVFLDGDVALGKSNVLIDPSIGSQPEAQGPHADGALFLSVDIDVSLGRGSRIAFPTRDNPIFSGFADRGSSLKIRYDQASGDLLLKGAMAVRGGEVFYIQRNFFLKSARMVFNESNERFDPRVTVVAELRDRNEDGPVVITLSSNNQPISSFKPNLSSDPIMTEAQIAALLGQNLLGIGSEGDISIVNAAISGAEFIPQFNVTKAFESRIRESLGLDILFLRTQVIQRMLIDLSDRDASESKDPLASYLDETSLYAGKYLGDSIFVYGSANLREDPLVRSSGLRLDSELGAEFETPFGLVQWRLTPSSPESLFIDDQSISLSWKLSY